MKRPSKTVTSLLKPAAPLSEAVCPPQIYMDTSITKASMTLSGGNMDAGTWFILLDALAGRKPEAVSC